MKLRFTVDGLSVEIVPGRPDEVTFVAERKVRQLTTEELPSELRRMHRGMQIAIPPKKTVVSFADQIGLKEEVQTIFGSGQRFPTDTRWYPTDLVVQGARAWVRRSRWSEGGGETRLMGIQPPIRYDWAVAGAFILDDELRRWSDEFFEKHPLGKLIEAGDRTCGQHVYAPAGANPRLWSDVDIESENFSFLEVDNDVVRGGGAQAGIYQSFGAKFGFWSGVVSVFMPEYWQIRTEAWGHTPFRTARNGREELRFAPPYASLEADGEFRKQVQRELYSAELPNLPKYVAPKEASGEYATFWANHLDWRDFARRHNIWAREPRLGIHAPDPATQVMVPLTRDFAELAWTEGAKMLPGVIGEVPPIVDWEFRGDGREGGRSSGRSYFYIGAERGYCYGRPPEPGDGEGKNIDLFEREGSRDRYPRGWVRIRADRRVSYEFGLSVRDPNDEISGSHETVVYTDGLVKLAKH